MNSQERGQGTIKIRFSRSLLIRLWGILFIFLLFFCIISCTTSRRTGDIAYRERISPAKRIFYKVQIPAPHTHYLDISITIKKPSGSSIDMAMPAWSPGRYIVYDFARHIHSLEAVSGGTEPPDIERLDVRTWRVSGFHRGRPLTITYKVYANTVSGTFSHVSPEGALVNGASVFLFPVRERHMPVTLSVTLPGEKDWTITTGLPAAGGENRFYANNYDHLIDCPLLIGNIRTYTHQSLGTPVHICFLSPGPDSGYEQRLALHCKALCDAAGNIFGEFPFSRYSFLFFTGFTPGIYDGMEHMNSCCLTDISLISTENHVRKMTALAAHEFWHVWNLKCIRPGEFLSYDLTEETPTRSLWIVEGLTRYFQNVLQLRAGLITREKFRSYLSSYITSYEVKPGKKIMTLEEASLSTWFDRGSYEDTDRTNTRISYYNKGAVIGLLLDLKIRGLTAGRKGLEDVFKQMYGDYYKKGKGYTTEDFYSECEKIAGVSLELFFSQCVRGTDPLPYEACAEMCGFLLENRENKPVPFSGLVLDENKIINIIPGSNAEKAGFQKYDEILSVNGVPFGEVSFRGIQPGTVMMVSFLRYSRHMTVTLVMGEKIPVFYTMKEKALIPREIAEIREAFYSGWYH